ncbi:hypothetical protein EDM00_08325 [Ornithobacterium rhinotracheale]|nr:hypothetical protein [Ornithobacterium rhinotracheale]
MSNSKDKSYLAFYTRAIGEHDLLFISESKGKEYEIFKVEGKQFLKRGILGDKNNIDLSNDDSLKFVKILGYLGPVSVGRDVLSYDKKTDSLISNGCDIVEAFDLTKMRLSNVGDMKPYYHALSFLNLASCVPFVDGNVNGFHRIYFSNRIFSGSKDIHEKLITEREDFHYPNVSMEDLKNSVRYSDELFEALYNSKINRGDVLSIGYQITTDKGNKHLLITEKGNEFNNKIVKELHWYRNANAVYKIEKPENYDQLKSFIYPNKMNN